MATQTILVIEDEAEIREGIRILLGGDEYTILEAANGNEALEQFSDAIDLVILDIMMPGMSGLRVCEEIRKTSTVPILFLTAKAQESDKLMGLTAGGDDYLTKPFSYAELMGRVKALLRRWSVYRGRGQTGEAGHGEYLEMSGVKIARERNEVWVRGRQVSLTEIEYHILLLLMRSPTRTFTVQNIYESVWDEPYTYASNGTVMVHIRNLRVKIEENSHDPKLIQTSWGKDTASYV
ncbi:MAG: response regulator transcription factor [Coriobacteriales bacterium]|nr:response regulator transcription factor [Coriobacteriales bacterium]